VLGTLATATSKSLGDGKFLFTTGYSATLERHSSPSGHRNATMSRRVSSRECRLAGRGLLSLKQRHHF
jgi:hypothetical protein